MMANLRHADVARLAGASHRIGGTPDALDAGYLGAAGGSVARFVSQSQEEPAVAARQLVKAGLVSPSHPVAVALQEEGPGREADKMMTPASMLRSASQKAMEISRSTDDRNVRVTTAALVRRLGQGKMTHQAVAAGFETIAVGADVAGCKDTARQAGETSAALSIAGVRLRQRELISSRRRSGPELD